MGYTVVNFTMNVMGLLLTLHGSAVLRSIAYALKLPITNIVLCWPFIMHLIQHNPEHLTMWSVFGLVVRHVPHPFAHFRFSWPSLLSHAQPLTASR